MSGENISLMGLVTVNHTPLRQFADDGFQLNKKNQTVLPEQNHQIHLQEGKMAEFHGCSGNFF